MIQKILSRSILILLIVPFQTYSQNKFSLEEIIKISLLNNQQIKSARFNVEKEEAIKLKSFNIPKPELFIEYEGIKGNISSFESRKIGILQELEFPSAYFLRSDMQGSQVMVAKAELSRIINDLALDVKQNYYGLIYQQKLLEIAKEKLITYDGFLFTAWKKYDVGATSNLEVLSSKINKIKIENEIKSIESGIRIYQSQLRKLMNVDYDIEPIENIPHIDYTLSKDKLWKLASINNPDIQIAGFQKEKSANKISLSRSEILPNLSLRYYKQQIGNDKGFWGFEVCLGIPLWFWWEQTGSIKEANYEFKIDVSEEQNVKKSVENKLNQSLEEFENNHRQVRFFEDEALKESEEILRQAKISYEEGAIDYVEYLQVITVVYDTKIQYLNSIYNYQISILKLENLIAGEIK